MEQVAGEGGRKIRREMVGIGLKLAGSKIKRVDGVHKFTKWEKKMSTSLLPIGPFSSFKKI